MADVFLNAISYSMGDVSSSVVLSAKEGRLVSKAEVLAEAGFKQHFISSPHRTALDLAIEACEKLPQGSLKNIGAILFSSCLPANQNVGSLEKAAETRDVKYYMDFPASRLQAKFHLDQAFVVGLCQQACTGLLFALRMAKDLLAAESDLQSVLVITADRFPTDFLYEQAYNLISDGSVAAVVSRHPSGWKILEGHSITNGALSLASDDETVGTWFNYTHRLIEETLAKARLRLSDVKWIASQNMNQKGWAILSSILGFPAENVVATSMPEIGHMISGDNLVNLLKLETSGALSKGDKVMLPMAGYGLNWASLLLEWRGR